mmetsp:Transcript_20866/g.24828  ORF Transcript_20866/g.24828 Transcript_20866/m.24828 type:complete len:241 (+) Transcript_20866:54-776(+)
MTTSMAFAPSTPSRAPSSTSHCNTGSKFSCLTRITSGLTIRPHTLSSSFIPLSTPLHAIASPDVSGGPSVVYEAILPPTTTLVGMVLIVILCALGSWVWANQVVPTSRAKLALSKSRGEVKEYLEELKASDPAISIQSDTADEVVAASLAVSINPIVEEVELSNPTPQNEADRNFERWLFTDWLQDNKSARKAGRQKEPALPILKDAKWNSGDNPVLAASALIGIGVLFTAFTERVASLV